MQKNVHLINIALICMYSVHKLIHNVIEIFWSISLINELREKIKEINYMNGFCALSSN